MLLTFAPEPALTAALPVRTDTSALLLMDFQESVLAPVTGAARALEHAADALEVARETGMQVLYVRVALSDRDYAVVPAVNKDFGSGAEAELFADGRPETQIAPALRPRTGDVVLRKTRVGAFSTTDLDTILLRRGIETVVLAGVRTSGVVLSTVRDAADRDYRVVVLADACADADEELHATLTERVFPRQADVVPSGALRGLVTG